jgi:hypothetical protein
VDAFDKMRSTLLIAIVLGAGGVSAMAVHRSRPALPVRAAAHPLRFERNEGQVDEKLRFVARGRGYGLYFTKEGPTIALDRHVDTPRTWRKERTLEHAELSGSDKAVFSMQLAGGREVEPVGSDVLPGTSNYFIGTDPARWRQGVPAFGKVTYPRVLPGVDFVCYGADQGRLEYDLLLAPGVDPATVAFRFRGARSVELDGGDAVLQLRNGATVRQPPPVAYELDGAGQRFPVSATYAIRAEGELGFSVHGHDARRKLVIDPVLIYSTYLGGSAGDEANGIARDAAGNVFVVGDTASADLPTMSPFQGALAGGSDAMIARLDPSGALLYVSYFGGSSSDAALGVALDHSGNAYVVGGTGSVNLPTLTPAQPSYHGGGDGFVAKFSASGGTLMYSTYLGGEGYDELYSVAVDASGEASVAGYTESTTTLPIVAAAQSTNGGGGDGFVAKLSATGSSFVYSTYLGGSAADVTQAIALDPAGNAYAAGYTNSTNFPTTAGVLRTSNAGGYDAFVAKLGPAGSFAYSTLLGTFVEDEANAVAVDAGGNAYVTGHTYSSSFPTTAGAPQTVLGGNADAFVAKLNPTASALVYSTYLGGAGLDDAYGIGVDQAGAAYVLGNTVSTNFPIAGGTPVQATSGGGYDMFVAKLAPSGTALLYGTYLGGSANDYAGGLAISATGDVHVAGRTYSSDFPTQAAAQALLAGATDGVVIRLHPDVVAVPAADWRLALPALLAAGGLALRLRRRRAC